MGKRIVTGFSFVLALVAALVFVPWLGTTAHAYSQWSTNKTTGNCAACHGDFQSANYTSNVDGSAWSSSLHDGHRNTMLGTASTRCNVCHATGARFPVSLSSSVGITGFSPISCLGCHGRLENGPGGPGVVTGTGLRQHHIRTGAASCATSTCHSNENPLTFTPVPEKVLPPYYFTPDTAHPNKPTAPCNPSGNTESKRASGRGLDNDGNGLYDWNDPSCGATTRKVDFDKDGKTDIAIYRTSNGGWYVIPSSTPGTPSGVGWGGNPSDISVPGDYDGDGKTDYAVYRKSTGAWYVSPSGGGTPYGIGWGGDTSDIPVPGDYDGDGKTDIAVYRGSNGGWYIIPSLPPGTPYGVGWGGIALDKPVPGDYDGDGKTDVAIYRPSNGGWYIKPSSGATPFTQSWGGSVGDIPAPGDYDGDGKTDVAIYRPSTGTWYIIPSSTPGTPSIVHWGSAIDIPFPGDYDGDGKTDYAIYRKSTGAWYVSPSGGGTPYGIGWGGNATDLPVTLNLATIYEMLGLI